MYLENKLLNKTYIYSVWILNIGISLLLYALVVVAFENVFYKYFAIDLNNYFTYIQLFLIFGYFIFLYYIIIQTKKVKVNILKNRVKSFFFGLIFIVVGHFGLFGIYFLFIYRFINGDGSISGLILVPILLWIFVFYVVGFNMTSKSISSKQH
jgi:hypothetical protein